MYIGHTTPNVVCGVTFLMVVGIRNSGSVASGPTNVFLYDQYPDLTTVATVVQTVPALAAGASVDIPMAFTVNAGCGAVHTMRLGIAASAVAVESNEEDNVLTLTHTVRAPNLYLTDLTVPANPPCDAVPVGVRVNNNGTAATPHDGIVRFTDTYAGDPSYSRVANVSFPTMAAGTSRIVSMTFSPLEHCGHDHTVTAVVDPSGGIGEIIESDNSYSRTFHP